MVQIQHVLYFLCLFLRSRSALQWMQFCGCFFFGFLEECKRHICFKIAYHLLHRLQNIHKPTSTITMLQAMSTIRAINLVNNITTTTLRFAESSGLQFLRHQASMWFLKWNLSHIISIPFILAATAVWSQRSGFCANFFKWQASS